MTYFSFVNLFNYTATTYTLPYSLKYRPCNTFDYYRIAKARKKSQCDKRRK
jgi:hypothetical protein